MFPDIRPVFLDGPLAFQSGNWELFISTPRATFSTAIAPNQYLSRSWWSWIPEKEKAINLPESLELIRDILRTRTFDVSRQSISDLRYLPLEGCFGFQSRGNNGGHSDCSR